MIRAYMICVFDRNARSYDTLICMLLNKLSPGTCTAALTRRCGGGTGGSRGALAPPEVKVGGLSPPKIHKECQNARPFLQTTKSSNYSSPTKMQKNIILCDQVNVK